MCTYLYCNTLICQLITCALKFCLFTYYFLFMPPYRYVYVCVYWNLYMDVIKVYLWCVCVCVCVCVCERERFRIVLYHFCSNKNLYCGCSRWRQSITFNDIFSKDISSNYVWPFQTRSLNPENTYHSGKYHCTASIQFS